MGTASGGRCTWIPRTRPAGSRLYLEGAPAERVWYLKEGTVVLSRANGAGATTRWTLRRPGDLLAPEALVSTGYADTAEALTPVTLCGMARTELDRWLGPTGSPSRTLLSLVLKTRCEETPRRASADGTSTRRLAQWILDEARGGEAPRVPRKVVADLLGMLPETLSRALAKLQAAGAVKADRRTIRVADVDALLRAAGEAQEDTDDEAERPEEADAP
jgi:CRP-like cAMP-binding protein